VSIFVDFNWVSSIAAASSLAVDNDLSIESNWRGVKSLGENVESISKS